MIKTVRYATENGLAHRRLVLGSRQALRTKAQSKSGGLPMDVLASVLGEEGKKRGGQCVGKSSLSSFLHGIHFWRRNDTKLPLLPWQIDPANKEGNETNYFLSGSQNFSFCVPKNPSSRAGETEPY